jgi:hypothetical protein|tara:strand:- start:10247 stop:10741 length:495 start_codon:yes stop_codon:yes gene_type:complete
MVRYTRRCSIRDIGLLTGSVVVNRLTDNGLVDLALGVVGSLMGCGGDSDSYSIGEAPFDVGLVTYQSLMVPFIEEGRVVEYVFSLNGVEDGRALVRLNYLPKGDPNSLALNHEYYFDRYLGIHYPPDEEVAKADPNMHKLRVDKINSGEGGNPLDDYVRMRILR